MADDTEETDCDFYVGEEFESYEAFQEKLGAYQVQNLCLFVTHRSEKSNDASVQFHSVKLKCKHFGKKRDNFKATGERALQKSYKIGCTAGIHVSGRASGKLVVTYFNNQHNHPCNKTTYYGYPEVRKLSKESQEDIGKYAKLKAKPIHMKPLLKAKEDSSIIILGRDIHNAKAKQKRIEVNGRSEEEMLIDKLNEVKANDPTASAHLQYNAESKEVEFVFIQSSAMKRALEKFPEVLVMDCTYKTNKNRMPVCIIEAIDGEGVGQPVAYAILSSESKDILTSTLLHFVTVSGEQIFEKTACVLVDKSFAEIGAIRAVMPNAQVHLCCVHSERAVKIGIKGDPNKKEVMEWFRKMLYAEDDKTFQECYKGFNNAANEKSRKYLLDNWMHCKEVWSLKDRALVTTLREHSTNRVESINRVMKIVADVDTPLYEAVSGFVDLIQGNRDDALRYRDHEALTKTVHINNCHDPIISKVCNELTLHAAKIVCAQYEMALKPSPAPERHCVSGDECTCIFFKTIRIPCRHIIRQKKRAGIPWYDKNLVPVRWHKDFNVGWWQSLGVEREAQKTQATITKRMPAGPLTKILGASDKFKKARSITEKIDGILTNSGTKTFHERFQFLKDLEEAWSEGREVSLLHHSESVTGNDGVVLESANFEEKQDNGSKEDTVPFRLTSPKIVGRPRGLKETVHDGSKKQSASKVKNLPSISTIVRLNTQTANLCCVCKEEAGGHLCSTCGRVVHAIPPCSVPGPEEGFGKSCLCSHCGESQAISNVKVSDNSKKVPASTTKHSPCPTVNDALCCVCKREAGEHHCSTCGRVVHAIPPCSVPGPEEGFGKSCLCSHCGESQAISNVKVSDNSKKVPASTTKHSPCPTVNDALCCVCKREAGEHHCSTCGRVVHAIPPCSVPGPEEGFGKSCLCTLCEAAELETKPVFSYHCKPSKDNKLIVITLSSDDEDFDDESQSDKDKSDEALAHFTLSSDDEDFGSELRSSKDENDKAQAHLERPSEQNSFEDFSNELQSGNDEYDKAHEHLERPSERSRFTMAGSFDDFDDSERLESEVLQTLTKNDTQDASSGFPQQGSSATDGIRATQHSESESQNTRERDIDAVERSQNGAPFELKIIKTSGRPKTTSLKNHSKWNFSALSNKSGTECVICEKEAEDDKCSSCSGVVHSHLPCSVSKADSTEIICNYCCDMKNEDFYPGVPKSLRLYRKEPPYFCHGCEYMLKMFVAKSPKDPKKKGHFYFGCLKKLSPGCNRFLFWWSPKQPPKNVGSSSSMETVQRGTKRPNEDSQGHKDSQGLKDSQVVGNPFKICDVKGLHCLDKHKVLMSTLKDPVTNKKVDCKCLPSCVEVNYISENDHTIPWFMGTCLKWGMNKYPRMRLKRDVLFGFIDVLVAVGGTAGLFLGCSVLSIVEIIYFFTLKAFFYVKEHYKDTPEDEDGERPESVDSGQPIVPRMFATARSFSTVHLHC